MLSISILGKGERNVNIVVPLFSMTITCLHRLSLKQEAIFHTVKALEKVLSVLSESIESVHKSILLVKKGFKLILQAESKQKIDIKNIA